MFDFVCWHNSRLVECGFAEGDTKPKNSTHDGISEHNKIMRGVESMDENFSFLSFSLP